MCAIRDRELEAGIGERRGAFLVLSPDAQRQPDAAVFWFALMRALRELGHYLVGEQLEGTPDLLMRETTA